MSRSLFWFSVVACFVYECSISPAPFIEKSILPPLNAFAPLSKNQLDAFVWDYFRAPYPIMLSCVFIPPPMPHALDHCNYIMGLEIGYQDSSNFIFFSKNCFSIIFPLLFNINIRMIFSISIKYLAEILAEMVLNLYINLERTEALPHLF